jgi:hypothetical protein
MEYLLGSIITILAVIFLRGRLSDIVDQASPLEIKYRQSHIFQMVKPFLDLNAPRRRQKTQSSVYEDKMHVKVVLVGDEAYWILNNVLFVANEIDGMIDKETTRPVDTMGMDKVQLDKMIFIVETLTEGKSDEDWDTRN